MDPVAEMSECSEGPSPTGGIIYRDEERGQEWHRERVGVLIEDGGGRLYES